MKAEAKSLRFLGEGKQLTVPFFQRRYVWDVNNWNELLETFKNDDTMPFLGSVILKEESTRESVIIDGQQRLTTITILAKAIYDCLSPESKAPGSGIRNCIENFLFYKNNSADNFSDSIVRIKHSRLDSDEYVRVIESTLLHEVPEIQLAEIDDSKGNVLKCYKYYCQQLSHCNDDELKTLFNSIFNDSRKVFVLIELSHGDINEQTIFDTINRAGVHLNTADIIKNNIFKKMLDTAGEDDTLRNIVFAKYETCWNNIFNLDKTTSVIWDEERIFGNVKHTNLEFLLYCVACIMWGEDSDMFSKLENVFTHKIGDMNWDELNNLVDRIKEYALIFKKFILDFKEILENDMVDVHSKYKDNVNRLLFILQKFKVQMFYPYIIKRLDEVHQDVNDENLKRDFQILESFIVRRKISSKGTHDYTSKCYSMINNGIIKLVETDLGSDNAGISDTDIKRYLHSTKDEDAKMILFWTELFIRTAPGFDVDSLVYKKYTLEHIMPQKWETNWANVPILDNGIPLDVTSEQGKIKRNSAIQSIGNKTLLTGSLNSSVKNAVFSVKINGLSESKPGYKKFASLQITKELIAQAEKDPIWDESHIENRTESLYNWFVKIWPSFIELIPSKDSANNAPIIAETAFDLEDADLSLYSEEEFADPVKLSDAVPTKCACSTTFLTTKDFIKAVDVQEETIAQYIKDGRIVPDSISGTGAKRFLFFSKETIQYYAKLFNWTLITDENRKTIFLKMISKMTMSYSYKPVFIKSLFECIDSNGKCDISELVSKFWHFYQKRISDGLIAEQKDSVMVKKDCSLDETENLVLTYPLKRFTDMGVIDFSKENKIVSINNVIWSKMSQSEKNSIIHICEEKIAEYYSKGFNSNESN